MSEFFVSTKKNIGKSTLSVFYAPSGQSGLAIPQRVIHMEGHGGSEEYLACEEYVENWMGVVVSLDSPMEPTDDIEPVTADVAISLVTGFIGEHVATTPSEISTALPADLREAIADSDDAISSGFVRVLDALPQLDTSSDITDLHTGQYL